MNTLTFSFRPAASTERQESVLNTVNSWDGVNRAGLLKPEAKHEEVRLMAYAYVADDADANELGKRLSEIPEVDPESVAVAPLRRLV
jgi:hypothetical protein